MKKIEEFITSLISEYPLYIGGLILIIAVIGILYKIYNKQSFRMKDYSAAGGKEWLTFGFS